MIELSFWDQTSQAILVSRVSREFIHFHRLNINWIISHRKSILSDNKAKAILNCQTLLIRGISFNGYEDDVLKCPSFLLVQTSSLGHLYAPSLDLDDLNYEKRPFKGNNIAYCESKLANVLFTRELAKRWEWSMGELFNWFRSDREILFNLLTVLGASKDLLQNIYNTL